MKKNYIMLVICCLFLFEQPVAIAQDSISTDDMKPYSYDFGIDRGQFQGAGAKVLKEAVSMANITMVGYTLDSKLDAEFSKALIRILNSNDYKKMVLEEGWISGNIINELGKNPRPVKAFAELNQKYSFSKDDKVQTPIPGLKSIEAAEYVGEAVKNDWTIFAIGVENWTSYSMLIDRLYANIPKEDQDLHKDLYERTGRILDTGYGSFSEPSKNRSLKFTNMLQSSGPFNSFLEKMEQYPANEEMVCHFKKSLEYWYAEGEHDYFKKNVISTQESRQRLASMLKKDGFDIATDKLFLKIFLGHLAKGVTENAFYGAGSMIRETSEFYGNTTLSIGVVPRFFEKDGDVDDYLNSNLYYIRTFKELLHLGKKNDWVLVDLRPFTEKLLYSSKRMSSSLLTAISRYDMLIIPKTDSEPTPN